MMISKTPTTDESVKASGLKASVTLTSKDNLQLSSKSTYPLKKWGYKNGFYIVKFWLRKCSCVIAW